MVGRFEQFCTAISSICRSIQKIERREMAKYGLKGPHAQCMLAMDRHPEGITAARLCQICEKDKAAISRAISELTEAKMIVREDEGKHYRSCLRLTQRGREVAGQVRSLAAQTVAQVSLSYSPEERQNFVNVLNLISGNLQLLSQEGLTAAGRAE